MLALSLLEAWMRPVVRSVIAVLAGLAVAMFVIAGIEHLSSIAFPPAAGLDPRNPEDMRRIVADAPAAALILVITAWTLGTFIGGYVAARFARRAPGVHAGIVALAILVGTVINLTRFEHPAWFWAAGIAGVVLAGVGAARLGGVTRAATS